MPQRTVSRMAELLHFPKVQAAGGEFEGPLQGLLPFFAIEEPVTAEQATTSGPLPDTLGLPDPEARRAALDIHRSWIVEAPAGSGKTGLLIQRLLKLLAFGDVERPNELLAITFTRKAAAELRNRVLEQLAAAAAGESLAGSAGEYERETRDLALRVLARDRALGWNLLSSPHTLNISTIDAFCAALASSQPLLSAGAGRYRPVDDASQLYEFAAERTLRQLGGPDLPLHESLRCVLLHRDAEVGDTVQLIAGMLAEREQWGELVPLAAQELTDAVLDGSVRPRLEASLRRAVCAGLSRAADAVGPELLGELAYFAATMAHEPGYKGVSPIRVCAGLPNAPGAQADALDHWLALLHLVLKADGGWRRKVHSHVVKFEISKAAQERLQSLVAKLEAADNRQPGLREALCEVRALPPVCYPDDQWRVVKALFLILRRALAELKVLFAERRECDFTEIALTARQLLRSDSDILALPGIQLSHLLVDEMQDTSAGQYELLELLSRSWDGATQTVFLVGDPKQSIYLFRQARVARFLRTQATGLLGDLPLGALRLTANFRSQSHLVDDFNEVFEQVLAPSETAGVLNELQIPFVAATATRSGASRPALRWHARLKDDGPAAEEAREIRAVIEDFLRRWERSSALDGKRRSVAKVAVLARGRSHLSPVLAEFRTDRGSGALPFRAVDVERLDDRQEILDLLALTRALLHPGDRTAWMAVLRSPVFGLGLGDLLLLAGEGDDAQPSATVPHLVATRSQLLSEDGRRILDRVWPTLETALGALGRSDFTSLVARTWRSLGADAFLGSEQRTNARRYLQLLRKLEADPEQLTLTRIMRGLSKLYAEPLAGNIAVELMTIHKAKGLEWDLVIVPAVERKTGDHHHELLKWLELDGTHGEQTEMILSPIAGKGEASSRLSAWLGKAQAAREEAETKRLLYVACTRAREELHLFATCEKRKDGSLSDPAAGSLLRAAWPAARPVFDELFRPQATLPNEAEAAIDRTIHPTSLSLAAAAESVAEHEALRADSRAAQSFYRLPGDFDPLARFHAADGMTLPYPAAESLRRQATFDRPEGSFAARAFGNVVHRFLDLLAEHLERGLTNDALRAQINSWQSRILASFRSEGLPPSLCIRETERTVQALSRTLMDAGGAWILSSHTRARSEYSLRVESNAEHAAGGQVLRADRIFLGGANALTTAEETHLWIVDFKTAEPGGRSLEAFLRAERRKYEPQMQAYARAMLARAETSQPVVLALFYPLIPHLLYWPYNTENASD